MCTRIRLLRLYKGVDTSELEVIPAKTVEGLGESTSIRRVAAYVRVSTDNDEQTSSYRLEGKSVPRQQLVSFDLDIPFLVENGKALDENPSPTKPLCGEELSAAESSSASPIKRDSGAL